MVQRRHSQTGSQFPIMRRGNSPDPTAQTLGLDFFYSVLDYFRVLGQNSPAFHAPPEVCWRGFVTAEDARVTTRSAEDW